jgi:hypothetical protein
MLSWLVGPIPLINILTTSYSMLEVQAQPMQVVLRYLAGYGSIKRIGFMANYPRCKITSCTERSLRTDIIARLFLLSSACGVLSCVGRVPLPFRSAPHLCNHHCNR